MRPSGVVLDAPHLDCAPCIRQADESALIQAFVPKSAVDALDVAVLDQLTGRDERERDAAPVRPLVEVLTRELGPFNADKYSG